MIDGGTRASNDTPDILAEPRRQCRFVASASAIYGQWVSTSASRSTPRRWGLLALIAALVTAALVVWVATRGDVDPSPSGQQVTPSTAAPAPTGEEPEDSSEEDQTAGAEPGHDAVRTPDPDVPLPSVTQLQQSTVEVTRDLTIEHPDLVTADGEPMPATEYDIYVPTDDQARPEQGWPVLIWAHGGSFVFGSKEQITALATFLADSGIVVVSVNYALAPQYIYPTALTQLNAAMEPIVTAAAQDFGVDPTRVALGGDSAGMSLMGQLVALQTDPDLRDLTGLGPPLPEGTLQASVLYCGPTNMDTILDTGFPGVERIIDVYGGGVDFATDPRRDELSLVRWVTPEWPATYSSCSLADPLLSQGQELEQELQEVDVPVVISLPDDPTLGHSYQFNFSGVEQRAELGRTIQFLHEYLVAD